MTKSILVRIVSILRPARVEIWQPRASLTAQDGYDLWYGTVAFTSRRRRPEPRRCCSDLPQ